MSKQCIVVTNPMIAANKSAEVTLSKFLRVISKVYSDITVIGGNISLEKDLKDIKIVSIPITRASKKIKRILDIARLQLKMASYLSSMIVPSITVYFWVGDKMILPYWIAQKKGADIRYFVYGNVLKEGKPTCFTKLSAKLIAYMANNADSLCVESPSVKQEWGELLHNERIRNIHLYTTVSDDLDLTGREKIVGMICRLTPGKHVIESIHAFKDIRDKNSEYKLEIVGSGCQESECRELIKSLQAESYIKMLGWIEHDEVLELVRRWKYLLFPSDTEGMPNSVLEMMGQGIPVIASPVGGIVDIIQEGYNGWFVENTTSNCIADTLINVCENNDVSIYAQVAYNARKSILSEFVLERSQEKAIANC